MKTINRAVAVLLCVLFYTNLFSSHIVGGEVTYTFKGFKDNNTVSTFAIELTMYRDPGGIDFEQVADFGVYKENPDGSWSKHLIVPNVPIGPILEISANADPCKQELLSTDIVQTTTYNFDIDLEIINTSYLIAYQTCCRNWTLNNITDPGNTGAVYDVTITAEAQRVGNNSPKFKSYPPIYICAGFDLSFDHSAVDNDGDQLRYSFCAPSDPGFNPDPNTIFPPYNSVNYVPPFSAANPVGGSPQIAINFITGEISGFPDILGSYVVGVCIEEVRDGKVLSRIRRDFEFNIVNCVFKVLAGIESDQVITNNTNGANELIYVIDSCQQTVINFTNTSIQVANIANYKWEFWDSDQTQVIDIDGAGERDPSVEFPTNGIFNGHMVAYDEGGSCSDTAKIQIKIFPIADSEFNYSYDACEDGAVSFENLTNYEDVDVVSWYWDFGDGSNSNEIEPDHKYNAEGNYDVTLLIEDSNGCSGSNTQSVNWDPHLEFVSPPEVTIDTILCPGDSIFLLDNWLFDPIQEFETVVSIATGCDSLYKTFNVMYFDDPIVSQDYQFICDGEEVVFGGEVYSETGQYAYALQYANTQCDSVQFNLELEVGSELQVENFDSMICFGESFDFFNQTCTVEDLYEHMELSSRGCDSILHRMYLTVEPELIIENQQKVICEIDSFYFNNEWLFEAGSYSEMFVSEITGCDSLERILTLTLDEAPEVYLDEEVSIFEGQDTKLQLSTNETDLSFLWTPDVGLSCTTCQNPIMNLLEDQEYEVEVTNSTGCISRRRILVTVDKPIRLYMANVIDPTQPDNSTLFLQCNPELEFIYDLYVYDRWGNLAYSSYDNTTNDPSTGWKGKKWDAGVYVYKVEIKANIEENTLFGTITLLR